MTAEEYFEEHSIFPEGQPLGPFIYEEDFLRFNELKEEYLTKKLIENKDNATVLLQHLLDHEWNISGGGVTRIKEFLLFLNASK